MVAEEKAAGEKISEAASEKRRWPEAEARQFDIGD